MLFVVHSRAFRLTPIQRVEFGKQPLQRRFRALNRCRSGNNVDLTSPVAFKDSHSIARFLRLGERCERPVGDTTRVRSHPAYCTLAGEQALRYEELLLVLNERPTVA